MKPHESNRDRLLGIVLHLFAFGVIGAIGIHFSYTKFKKASSILDHTAGRSSVCEIHQVEMQRVRVPILAFPLYSPPSDPPLEVSFTQFPHAKETDLGGCTVMARQAYIYVCATCKEARQNWMNNHVRAH